jgi:imidazolonepropionase-like amidohydrolase
VDSLKAAGVDMAFIHGFDSSQAMRKVVFAILAEARRVHLPAVGHLDGGLTLAEASDSGMHSVDHLMGLADICTGKMASLKRCAAMAARLQRNDTWMVTGPTLKPARQTRDSMLMWVERAHLPLLYGTDVELSPWLVSLGVLPGFQLHEDLATSVARGLSPLSALRGVTLNPARMLHATDSLGTVAPGKLADLVLLDADPLADITHTKQIRAVVANGRYFDRTALDSLLTEAREKQKRALSKP